MRNEDDTNDPSDGASPGTDADATEFDALLSESIRRRGLTLAAIQQRLRDRGHPIATSTLSMWRTGARRPERETSLDAIRELEQILEVPDGFLTDAVGPSRRVGPDRHRPFAEQIDLPQSELTEEPVPELFERSGTVSVFVDADSRIHRTINRTLWQARRDGARDATVFYSRVSPGLAPPEVRGTLGCELIDVVVDPDTELLRATLRLDAPLRQGELALSERESVHAESEPEHAITIVAPRRQAEVIVRVAFEPNRLPRRCWAFVEVDESTRTHSVAVRGTSATHAEFDFGPGMITLQWEW